MPYLDLPGVRLWFEDSGGNHIPAIFLHAASGTFESWVHQLPAFTQAGFRCITYDRRGGVVPSPWRQEISLAAGVWTSTGWWIIWLWIVFIW